MKILMPAILIYCFSLCKAQTYTSSCVPLDTIGNHYLNDAKKLNWRYIFASNNTYKDSIALSRTITDKFHRALLAVYNATNSAARDSVVSKWKIHANGPPLDRVIILADPNLPWIVNLANNVQPTGQPSLDSLMQKHYLKKTYYVYNQALTQYANVGLGSDTLLNTYALQKFLKSIPGVHEVRYDSILDFKLPNIIDTMTPQSHILYYSYEFHNPCGYGCSFARSWRFVVNNNCSVEYGGYFPMFVGLKELKSKNNFFKVYPNPTNGKITIEGLPSKCVLSITDIIGRQITIPNSEPDLYQAPPGVYYISATIDGVKYISKIIKD